MKTGSMQDLALNHIPVMSTEILSYLEIESDGVYIDGTIGPGGHATSILNNLGKHGKLIGIDRDEEALKICNENFCEYVNSIKEYNIENSALLGTYHVNL